MCWCHWVSVSVMALHHLALCCIYLFAFISPLSNHNTWNLSSVGLYLRIIRYSPLSNSMSVTCWMSSSESLKWLGTWYSYTVIENGTYTFTQWQIMEIMWQIKLCCPNPNGS
jgi:hypothetical protein